jgi:hypothetical protein
MTEKSEDFLLRRASCGIQPCNKEAKINMEVPFQKFQLHMAASTTRGGIKNSA